LKDLIFNSVDFEHAEFYKTSLKDIDLSTSDISSLRINKESIEGAIIDSFQAEQVCYLLGIKIKDR